MKYTFTEQELKECLERAIRGYIFYQTKYNDSEDCAISNVISGVMEEETNREAFSKFNLDQLGVEPDQLTEDWQAFGQDVTRELQGVNV